ncbi:unnamed protein product [Lupinus luteus]|uniref:Uncharacterized protein n=1 Tax=Lupinus luteus TaxID=3873 RepID=A0AAV1WU74_LUPLU
MSKVWLILYSNGRIYEGPHGTTFEGDKKSIQIERGICLENLKSEIGSKLMYGKSQVISKLSTKMLVEENSKRYIEYVINDDSDIRCMIDMFNESSFKSS